MNYSEIEIAINEEETKILLIETNKINVHPNNLHNLRQRLKQLREIRDNIISKKRAQELNKNAYFNL